MTDAVIQGKSVLVREREIRTDITGAAQREGEGSPASSHSLSGQAHGGGSLWRQPGGVRDLYSAQNPSLSYTRRSMALSALANPMFLKFEHEPPGDLLKHRFCTPRGSESVGLTRFQVAHAPGLQTTLRAWLSSLTSPHLIPSRPVSSTNGEGSTWKHPPPLHLIL